MTPADKSRLVGQLAQELGFDRVGVTRAAPSPAESYYRRWLASGYAGSMAYLRRHIALREDPSLLLPGARSIICVAASYARAEDRAAPAAGTGRISCYVRGADYHRVLGGRLRCLVQRLRERLPEAFDARVFVDTGPLLERRLAASAGLGWIGKNTMLLHERLGSYLFLGEVVTTLELEPDAPAIDRCGRCTRCLDACPTRAFPRPYELDASRCISYLTVEHRGTVPPEFHKAIGDWVYGCDVCQEVCPFNRHAPDASLPELVSGGLPPRLPLLDLLTLGSSAYRRLTHGTAARRARRNMWRRNAAIALGNAERLTEAERQALLRAAGDEDQSVRDAARQALAGWSADQPGSPVE